MNYQKPKRAIVPTPTTATEALHTQLVQAMSLHYMPLLTAELLIANRKGCYATVINSTYDNTPIEQLLGTVNAKFATEQVLENLTHSISAVVSTK